MKKDSFSEEHNEAILKALDYAIHNGPWDKSNFLRSIGNRLIGIRDNYAKKINLRSREQIQSDAYLANRLALRGNQQEVFVSLYSSDGSNIQSWERIIINLPRQMISRPIYENEEQVKALIKTKENKQNEAYVAIYINKTDIIPLSPDKTLYDKLGSTLLTLKDRSLDLENVTRFVHISGVYKYSRGRLIKE
ncbi:Dot/Icm secretion system protein IcmQ [Fluoribacter dumoffii]|uniref:IcmQ n=1 Tax=Fluoribacter dumoffii TaxID=463 RepID=D6BJN9_9GAMM|nr:Dot/Icm secretion system protein IcmQ [Fluoribacter dumoffii]ACF77012.1 IcmQ [Fluoribacter dumoffii]KTC91036.1 IcmQ protein [Fluoribacter dumoffii NY 23]MCW8386605.1 Dot/Icm secretion system protein IcmQ [Fluoribacter dumoffii]MCW8419659.1 Dot/Icm secretion system protein IcmQ [Fluoribacter dumoffii]MCW8455638.1 Dot/Icm secretion system protein IcmQ [Fluoribacter dumoffii]